MTNYRKYHVLIEGDLETNMTIKEIKELSQGVGITNMLDKMKVIVKPLKRKKEAGCHD